MKLSAIVVHPFLFGTLPVLFVYSHNLNQISIVETLRPLLVMLFLTGLMWVLIKSLLSDSQKAALILSSALFGFVLLEGALTWSHSPGVPQAWRNSIGAVVILFFAGVFVGLVRFVARTPQSFTRLTNFLNVTALAMVSLNIAVTLNGISRSRKPEERKFLDDPLAHISRRPSIYYIVLDGYARGDILQELYQYDNSPFLNHLSELGFYVAPRSRANYIPTFQSLASSLNFDYLEKFTAQFDRESEDRLPLATLIRDNRAARLLRGAGYKFVTFQTGVSVTEIKKSDIYLKGDPWSLTELEHTLLNLTPLKHLVRLNGLSFDPDHLHRMKVLNVLDHLTDFTKTDSPVFVFAHILAAHPPFVFGEHGEPVDDDVAVTFRDDIPFPLYTDRQGYIRSYRQQLVYFTTRIQAILDRIIKDSTEPPVIILQSDHGPGSRWDMVDPETPHLNELMSVLNAYYLPSGGRELLYPEITPVNTFRVVLNGCFNTRYPLLKDESFFTTWKHPYQFINVTGKLKQAQSQP